MTFDVSETVALARWWWTFILRGLLAIAFGVLAFLAPAWGIVILVALFAAWAFVDGATSLFIAFSTRETDRHWWLELIEGLVSMAAGVIALLLPVSAVAKILVLVIAVWAVLTGALEIWAAIRLRERIQGELLLGLAGLSSILFGIVLFLFPGAGALSLVWLIGGFAIAFGVFLIALGWRLRRIDELAKRDAAHDYGSAG